ncbi:MAG: helix-turn-helix domain-containing protein [Paenibacillaceae bacterium]|nr:helix-turn-helix domain-containing protein [Paenibacillaceae bacterium]
MANGIELLLVEDEADVLAGMEAAVREMAHGFTAIHAAGNAEDALAIIASRRPHIVVTDIVLPRMSGLELIEAAIAAGCKAKTVVVSSYDKFGYVQRSLQLGAVDYVLKPIDKAEFCAKLTRLAAVVADERERQLRVRRQEEQALIGTKLLQEQFVLGLCTQKAQLLEHVVHRLQMWGLLWLTTTPYAVAVFRIDGDAPQETGREGELRLFSVGNVAAETASRFERTVLVKNAHNVWIAITAEEDVEALCREIRDNVRRYQRIELVFGVSSRMYAFQSLPEAYEQGVQALRFADARRLPLAHYSDVAREAGGDAAWSDDMLAELLLAGETERLAPVVGDMLNRLVMQGRVAGRSQLAQACLNGIIRISGCISRKTGLAVEQIPLALWEKLERCDDLEAVKRELIDYYAALSDSLCARLGGLSNAIIEKAKAIIESQADRHLSQQVLAEKLAIHPVWLSRLFKKETGRTFSDYVTDVRMERAKQLLRDSSMRIYEIASLLGYQDLQHFGKVFKKRAGVTPKEYRYGK